MNWQRSLREKNKEVRENSGDRHEEKKLLWRVQCCQYHQMFRGQDWNNWIEYIDIDVIGELSMSNSGVKLGTKFK